MHEHLAKNLLYPTLPALPCTDQTTFCLASTVPGQSTPPFETAGKSEARERRLLTSAPATRQKAVGALTKIFLILFNIQPLNSSEPERGRHTQRGSLASWVLEQLSLAPGTSSLVTLGGVGLWHPNLYSMRPSKRLLNVHYTFIAIKWLNFQCQNSRWSCCFPTAFPVSID